MSRNENLKKKNSIKSDQLHQIRVKGIVQVLLSPTVQEISGPTQSTTIFY